MSALAVVRRVRRRARLVSVLLAALAAGVFLLALSVGTATVSLPDVLSTLAGQGSSDTNYIVLDRRLPRALTGLLVGAAFGLSGAILQSLLGNPLASPDVIGISAGAGAAAVTGIVAFGLGGPGVAAAALVGALATAALMYLLAWRDGVTGYRLVLVGIGLAAILLSVISYFMTRSQVTSAQDALVWLTGSLNDSGWDKLVPLAVALVLLLPAVAAAARALDLMGFGDDTASGLGLAVPRARLGLLLCAVALAGTATATAGPIAFVALLSAPIGRRLARDGGPALLPSTLVGAVIVVAADFAAQHTPGLPRVPVGVLTGAIGAPYLLILLARMNRGGHGG
ncbi:FecCD family ABC transporter permease [Actinophytocola gossypii]|uniref:Iron chelate uptake ABC transporter family permease subunit n=1 Tax=Actinophytocola gossypii TaxID=2812003 RepID=A0ABT2JGE8_9PSEU|nr:iron chelate uptake ABC transporter family permease subunit [Actinophytocola gossypii]MCT2586359.1 iron chelate uptake ABC transporter family permease subunit [Actinophytocola gossypii]